MKSGLFQKIRDSAYDGLFAFFLVSLGILALLILLNLGSLPWLVENFQADSFDTILTVKWFREYGLFGNIPFFSDDYALFGNFPVLYGALGSIIDLVLNNPSLSTAVLYWIIDIALAFLLWTKFLKNCDWKVKTLFVAFFLFNIVFGNLFPLGYRKRQQLAILIGMLSFLTESLPLQGVISFAALLAQPFSGALMILLRMAAWLEKKKLLNAALLLIPFLLAYPFYAHSFSVSQLEPRMSGCSFITQNPYPGMIALFLLVVAIFHIWNRKKIGFIEFASLGVAFALPAFIIVFMLLRLFAPFSLIQSFLFLTSFPCYDNLFNVAAAGVILSIHMKKAEMPRPAMLLLLLMTIISIALTASFLIDENREPLYAGFFDMLNSNSLSHVKTMDFFVIEHSDGIHFMPIWSVFGVQGYALYHNLNVTFVDEYNMPPQLSKGKSNLPMAALPPAIYAQDSDGCRNATASLRSDGVEGLVYVFNEGLLLPADFRKDRFLDDVFLHQCGLSVVSDYPLSSNSQVVIYKLE